MSGRSPRTVASPGLVPFAIRPNTLIWFKIKATSNCEESDFCIVQSIHGRVPCGGEPIPFVQKREVLRVGPLMSEAREEIGNLCLSRTRGGIT